MDKKGDCIFLNIMDCIFLNIMELLIDITDTIQSRSFMVNQV